MYRNFVEFMMGLRAVLEADDQEKWACALRVFAGVILAGTVVSKLTDGPMTWVDWLDVMLIAAAAFAVISVDFPLRHKGEFRFHVFTLRIASFVGGFGLCVLALMG